MSGAAAQRIADLEKAYGSLPDDEIDLAAAALDLAMIGHPERTPDSCRRHIDDMIAAASARHEKQSEDTLETRLATLRETIGGDCGYVADPDIRDDIHNADLVSVIERRRGMPVALGVLYIHVARGCGWIAHGLNFPGHFLIRLDLNGQRVIADPADSCIPLDAPALRMMIKHESGPKAELSADYYEPMKNRAILIRLYNIVKTRLIGAMDYEGALRVVDAMRGVDPQEYRLSLDKGVLCLRANRIADAAIALEDYIARAPDNRDRHDAALLLAQIRQSMRPGS